MRSPLKRTGTHSPDTPTGTAPHGTLDSRSLVLRRNSYSGVALVSASRAAWAAALQAPLGPCDRARPVHGPSRSRPLALTPALRHRVRYTVYRRAPSAQVGLGLASRVTSLGLGPRPHRSRTVRQPNGTRHGATARRAHASSTDPSPISGRSGAYGIRAICPRSSSTTSVAPSMVIGGQSRVATQNTCASRLGGLASA
jgi:hypothetical protein